MRTRWIKGLSKRPVPPKAGFAKFDRRAQTFAPVGPRSAFDLPPHEHGERYLEHYQDGSYANRRWCAICEHPHPPYEFCQHFGEAIISEMAQEELSSIVGIPGLIFDPDPLITTLEHDQRTYSTPRLVEYRTHIRQMRMRASHRAAYEAIEASRRETVRPSVFNTLEETARLLAARRLLQPGRPVSLCSSCTFRRDENATTETTVYCGFHHIRVEHRTACADYIYENAPGLAGQPRTELPRPGTACSSCVNANHINTTSDRVSCNVYGNVQYRWQCSGWARRHRG